MHRSNINLLTAYFDTSERPINEIIVVEMLADSSEFRIVNRIKAKFVCVVIFLKVWAIERILFTIFTGNS